MLDKERKVKKEEKVGEVWLSKRPKREKVINKEDIINLKIALSAEDVLLVLDKV